jgi:hypothetical protein
MNFRNIEIRTLPRWHRDTLIRLGPIIYVSIGLSSYIFSLIFYSLSEHYTASVFTLISCFCFSQVSLMQIENIFIIYTKRPYLLYLIRILTLITLLFSFIFGKLYPYRGTSLRSTSISLPIYYLYISGIYSFSIAAISAFYWKNKYAAGFAGIASTIWLIIAFLNFHYNIDINE